MLAYVKVIVGSGEEEEHIERVYSRDNATLLNEEEARGLVERAHRELGHSLDWHIELLGDGKCRVRGGN